VGMPRFRCNVTEVVLRDENSSVLALRRSLIVIRRTSVPLELLKRLSSLHQIRGAAMLWPQDVLRLTAPPLRWGAASVAFLAREREDGRSRGSARTRPRDERWSQTARSV